MLSTIKGTYINRQVILEETPGITGPQEVLVTFTGKMVTADKGKKLVFGFAKGNVLQISHDFNEAIDDLKDYM